MNNLSFEIKKIFEKVDISSFKDGKQYIVVKSGLDLGNLLKLLNDVNYLYMVQCKDIQSNAIIIRNIEEECDVVKNENIRLDILQKKYANDFEELKKMKIQLDENVRNAFEQVMLIKKEISNFNKG